MDKEKFKLRLDLKTGNEEVDLYIYELHNYLANFETSSIKQMLIALDNIAFKMVDDLDSISEGDTDNLTILSDSKDSKVFDRLMTLVTKIKDFKEVCAMAETLRPEIAERKEEVKKSRLIIDTTTNPFEQIQRELLEKNKAK